MTWPSAWDQTADMEEGSLADFDSTSPAWDKEADFEEGDTTDFDSETDADGDLNASTDAAHDGSYGIEITFDDANAAYGELNLGAVNQVSIAVGFWFNANDIAVDANTGYNMVVARDGGGGWNLRCQFYNNAGQLQLIGYYRDDAGTQTALTNRKNISAATWYHVLMMAVVSTGVGNNDGKVYFYVNGELVDSVTNADNDTRDFDDILIGMISTASAGFGGSFYMDTIKIDPVGAPFASTLAAQAGSYGMAIPISDATGRYTNFTGPVADTLITVEFQFDPTDLAMSGTTEHTVMRLLTDGGTPSVAMRLEWQLASSTYRWSWVNWNDAGTVETDSTPYNHGASATAHTVRVVWSSSSGAGVDDGFMYLFVDDVHVASATGLDTDTLTIGGIDIGASHGIDATTIGLMYFDNCRWVNNVFIPQTVAGTQTFTGIVSKVLIFLRTIIAGNLTFIGALTRITQKVVSGITTFIGTVTNQIGKMLTFWLDDQIEADMHLIESPENEDE